MIEHARNRVKNTVGVRIVDAVATKEVRLVSNDDGVIREVLAEEGEVVMVGGQRNAVGRVLRGVGGVGILLNGRVDSPVCFAHLLEGQRLAVAEVENLLAMASCVRADDVMDEIILAGPGGCCDYEGKAALRPLCAFMVLGNERAEPFLRQLVADVAAV